jgi:hypothetical protein
LEQADDAFSLHCGFFLAGIDHSAAVNPLLGFFDLLDVVGHPGVQSCEWFTQAMPQGVKKSSLVPLEPL